VRNVALEAGLLCLLLGWDLGPVKMINDDDFFAFLIEKDDDQSFCDRRPW